jgi:hypothetical protein
MIRGCARVSTDGQSVDAQVKQLRAAGAEKVYRETGFEFVPDQLPMLNSNKAVVYYLFFASQNPVAKKIITDIFKKYRA